MIKRSQQGSIQERLRMDMFEMYCIRCLLVTISSLFIISHRVESAFNVLFYNKDALEAANIPDLFTNMQEFENEIQDVIKNQLISENYGFTGISTAFKGELWLSFFMSFLSGTEYSGITNPYYNDTTIATNSTAFLIQRFQAWIDANILNGQDFEGDGIDSTAAFERFINGKSLFYHDWNTAIRDLQKTEMKFEWDMAPFKVLTTGEPYGISVNNGWSFAVYKHAQNIPAAVKMIKYLTSSTFQQRILSKPESYFYPTYSELSKCIYFPLSTSQLTL